MVEFAKSEANPNLMMRRAGLSAVVAHCDDEDNDDNSFSSGSCGVIVRRRAWPAMTFTR